MREIHIDEIVSTVRHLCIEANTDLRPDTVEAFHRSLKEEVSEVGKDVLRQLIRNAEVARRQKMPFCQDTGYAVLFVELGQNVRIIGGAFSAAIDEGVRRGYREGFLRGSMVHDPLRRTNTGDNTPAVINTEIVDGDQIKIISITTPLDEDRLKRLRTGDRVHITGVLYTARDAAHKRMREKIQQNEKLPFDPSGQVLFYVGPTPPPPGRPIGSAGPTTAGRMDPYTPMLDYPILESGHFDGFDRVFGRIPGSVLALGEVQVISLRRDVFSPIGLVYHPIRGFFRVTRFCS